MSTCGFHLIFPGNIHSMFCETGQALAKDWTCSIMILLHIIKLSSKRRRCLVRAALERYFESIIAQWIWHGNQSKPGRIFILQDELERLKAESSVGQKLDRHRHIKLVGTYWKERNHLNILTFPVAVCDLGFFLDSLETCWTSQDDVLEFTLTDDARRWKDLIEIDVLSGNQDDEHG